MAIMTPCQINESQKMTTRKIVEEFLTQKAQTVELNATEIGRTENSLYTSLKTFLRKHENFKVAVRMQGGKVLLSRVE